MVNYVVRYLNILFFCMFGVCLILMEIVVVVFVLVDGGFVKRVFVVISSYNVIVER